MELTDAQAKIDRLRVELVRAHDRADRAEQANALAEWVLGLVIQDQPAGYITDLVTRHERTE